MSTNSILKPFNPNSGQAYFSHPFEKSRDNLITIQFLAETKEGPQSDLYVQSLIEAHPTYRPLSWSHFKPGHASEFHQQFRAIPISLIASLNLMSGETGIPGLGKASVFSVGTNVGFKLYNSLRLFFNYDDSQGAMDTKDSSTHFPAAFKLKKYHMGMGLNLPFHAAWLNAKLDVTFGRGNFQLQPEFVNVPIEANKLLSLGVSPQVCTLWDMICLGYQFSRSSVTKHSEISSLIRDNYKELGDVIARQHQLTFNFNFGAVIDWLWWRKLEKY